MNEDHNDPKNEIALTPSNTFTICGTGWGKSPLVIAIISTIVAVQRVVWCLKKSIKLFL